MCVPKRLGYSFYGVPCAPNAEFEKQTNTPSGEQGARAEVSNTQGPCSCSKTEWHQLAACQTYKAISMESGDALTDLLGWVSHLGRHATWQEQTLHLCDVVVYGSASLEYVFRS